MVGPSSIEAAGVGPSSRGRVAQNLFVYTVVVLAPLFAVGLLWTRHVRLALWLFLPAMCASLLFGIYYHYVFISPDNIHHLPLGSAATRARFVLSAAILALIELASALYTAFVLGWHRASGLTRSIGTT